MDSELISKKELLDVTGISYGQLYRWKRKQLIPEQWFIRKSAFTGQETFFPKELILSRIDHILNLKDDVSLDDLAEKLSGQTDGMAMKKKTFVALGILSPVAISQWTAKDEDNRLYSFEEMLYLQTADTLLRSGGIRMEEGAELNAALREHYPKFKGQPCDLLVIRGMGKCMFALVTSSAELFWGTGVKVSTRVAMAAQAERLKGILAAKEMRA